MTFWGWLLLGCVLDILITGYLIFQHEPALVVALIVGAVVGFFAAHKTGVTQVKEFKNL